MVLIGLMVLFISTCLLFPELKHRDAKSKWTGIDTGKSAIQENKNVGIDEINKQISEILAERQVYDFFKLKPIIDK